MYTQWSGRIRKDSVILLLRSGTLGRGLSKGLESVQECPDFGLYRHFCGTIIDARTDKNLNKWGMQHQLRQRCSAMDRFILKVILVEEILVPQKVSKLDFL